MRERADRRFATVVGLILGVAAFVGDLTLTPPPFIQDEVESVIESINGSSPTTTVPVRPTRPDAAPDAAGNS